MLLRNDEALRWRLLLADLAEETLDIQVFIWKDEASSDLLIDRVMQAADRGVQTTSIFPTFTKLGIHHRCIGINRLIQ